MGRKKDVVINIKGVRTVDRDSEEIELFTLGKYYKKDGTYCISYNESEATGFEGCQVTMRIAPDKVTMERRGTANSQLIIERGKRHNCYYDMGVGDMMIAVHGKQILSTLGDAGGDLLFSYSMDINAVSAGENKMYINVKECSD